jgi:hypothetical protein
MLKFIGIFFLVLLFLITLNITFHYIKPVIAKESESTLNINDEEEGYNNDKLVIVSDINLQNIEKEGFLKVVGVINGEDFVKNIPLDKLKDTTKKLKVTFSMDKDNEIVSAHTPDEFFVCAYHYINTNNNNLKSIAFDKKDALEYFDCNEGDIKSTSHPTKASLFKSKSQVYNKTTTYYNMYSKPKLVSFDTLGQDTIESANSSSVNNVKLGKAKNSNNGDSSNKPVQLKIIVPMEDKMHATKIKVMAMLKGQIKSEIVDVQKEFDKIIGYTIERAFAFDRNTDMGPIQIGDRVYACAIGQELYPPEGSECEKRLIKHLDKPNSLSVR